MLSAFELPKRKVSLPPLPLPPLLFSSSLCCPCIPLQFSLSGTQRLLPEVDEENIPISVPSTMPQWPLPFVPYPSSKDGYWSPVTSTLNWCEEVNIPFSFPFISWRELTLVCFNAIGLLCDHLRCRDRQYFDQFVVYVAWCQGNSKLSPIPT